MNWGLLREYLCEIPEDGASGFEGLVARMLALTLGRQFALAGRGLQPGGDASSHDGTVVIQAKRYKRTSSLNHSEIIGDIERALTTYPELDTYVLAAPRPIPNQLRQALAERERSTGLDIIALGLDDQAPDLGVLCVKHWPALKYEAVFRNTPAALADAIQKAHDEGYCDSDYAALDHQIREQWNTRDELFRQAQRRLGIRFGTAPDEGTRVAYEINLRAAVPRRVLVKQVADWWSSAGSPVGVVEGQEGVGKSWGVALAVVEIQRAAEVPVFWLDSIQWAERGCLAEILDEAVATVRYATRAVRKRIIGKILYRFSKPVLVVLDGANERGAVEKVDRLLLEVMTHGECSKHVRLLFTTRPLQGGSHIWRDCALIAAGAFDDTEMKQALAESAALNLADVPLQLIPTLRWPRYFACCMRLMNRFASIQAVTREQVLWEDLKDKIESLDAQVRDRLGFRRTDDAETVLQGLAKEALSPLSGTQGGGISGHRLEECFGVRYATIRDDLLELRIVAKATPERAVISEGHITLGCALLLQRLSRDRQDLPVVELADYLRSQLEPIASADCKSESLFVALQLSADHAPSSSEESSRRAALLLAWYRSHNANVNAARIAAWCECDLNAYLQFVEALYHDMDIGLQESLVIEPLARTWRRLSDNGGLLGDYLQRWLLFTWRHDQPAGAASKPVNGHALPVARTRNQLRLSAVAMSIISQRPDMGMLPALALSAATMNESMQSNDGREWPAKFLDKNLTILLRWAYTDKAIADLERLVAGSGADLLLAEGCRYLAACLNHLVVAPPLRFPVGHEWRARAETEFRLDAAGRVAFGPGSPPAITAQACFGTHAWGVDVSGGGAEDGEVDPGSLPEQAFASWKRDYERLERWVGFPFHAFAGASSLARWAETCPGEFADYTAKYTAALKEGATSAFHLGVFTQAVYWIAWNQALATCAPVPDVVGTWPAVRVVDQYGVESMVATLWKSRGIAGPEVKKKRYDYLLSCEDDEALMECAIAAMTAGTVGDLMDVCRAFLRGPAACIRNLAVSLLPWLGTADAMRDLEDVRANDESGWVREHAAWALEVAHQERSCRVWYARVLKEPCLIKVSAGLQAMGPALLPPCRSWRRMLEGEALFWEQCEDVSKKALLLAFWDHWGSLSSHRKGIRACGRKLTDWCRGQERDSFVSPRMFPWWHVG